jgi:ArsR family transcriptional regulator, arsenate/arsenite/antimonite-responsive transcriptional repressor
MEKNIDIIKAIGDITRYRIIKLIYSSGNKLCVNAIAKKLNVSQPTVSQHLKILKHSRIVQSDKMGNRIHYSVISDTIISIADNIKDLVSTKSENNPIEECQNSD